MGMASVVFDCLTDDLFNQAYNITSGVFYGMLVDNSYTPDVAGDTRRSDVSGEIAGTGYVAGGAATSVTVTKDTVDHREEIGFSNIVWAASTITARGIVIYHHRGGASSADELVCTGDFGSDQSSSSSTFTAVNTTPIYYQNNTY